MFGLSKKEKALKERIKGIGPKMLFEVCWKYDVYQYDSIFRNSNLMLIRKGTKSEKLSRKAKRAIRKGQKL